MLKVTSKEYEIEEPIQLTKNIDGEEKVIYEFTMKITEPEMKELKDILFNFANKNIGNYIMADNDEKKNLEITAEKEIKANDERLIDICFKNHKEEFRNLAGEYKFGEMIDSIRGFLLDFFMKKQMSPLNTTITRLMKITNSLPKFK